MIIHTKFQFDWLSSLQTEEVFTINVFMSSCDSHLVFFQLVTAVEVRPVIIHAKIKLAK